MAAPQVYTIPLYHSFVDVLAQGLLEEYGGTPLDLSRVLVLLPTRRSVRSLKEAFLRATGGKPILLPRMHPLGDVEEEGLLLAALLTAEEGEQLATLPPEVGNIRRKVWLARLIQQKYAAHTPEEEGDFRAMLGEFDHALRLAGDLLEFLDEIQRQELSAAELKGLVAENYALHWQKTLDFLSVILNEWPSFLQEQGRMDPILRRNAVLHLLAGYWKKHPPAWPVIAAGTTGSQPATAKLLAMIARLPQGRVILPGLDTEMDDESWDWIDETHPYFSMKELLEKDLHISRKEIREYKPQTVTLPATTRARADLLLEALKPAEATRNWAGYRFDETKALHHLHWLECRTTQEEAKTIGLILREVLETEGKTGALITHDKALARKVATFLRRYGIQIDDSEGQPLAETPHGVFCRLVMDAVNECFTPYPLLSLLKHPFCRLGMSDDDYHRLLALLELHLFRGVRINGGFPALIAVLEGKEEKEISSFNRQALIHFIQRLEEAFTPLMTLRQERPDRWLEAHVQVMETLARGAHAEAEERLWKGDIARCFSSFTASFAEAAEDMPTLDGQSYLQTLEQMLFGVNFHRSFGTHARLKILNPVEARLQHFDTVVLGGLNEENWPPAADADPWMSRPMKRDFRYPLPERKIGLSAHDFLSLSCAERVFYTRSEKAGGSPTTASRWLQRIGALLEGQSIPRERLATHHSVYAAKIDKPEGYHPAAIPAPKPALSLRPRELPVTAIEGLLRNPYDIYAQRILRLRKLEEVDQDVTAADLGNLIHEVMETLVTEFPDDRLPENFPAYLMEVARRHARNYEEIPSVVAFWLPRLERAIPWIEEQERARRKPGSRFFSEQQVKWTFPLTHGNFTLTARMDRLEYHPEEGLSIIDYKTGAVPSDPDIESGKACQLTLAATLVEQGNLSAQWNALVSRLEYWQIKGSAEASKAKIIEDKGKVSLRHWIDTAREGAMALLLQFEHPEQAYYCIPPDEGSVKKDFIHLARVKEWSR